MNKKPKHELKDKRLNMKVTQDFKDKLRSGAKKINLNDSQFVILAVDEKLATLEGVEEWVDGKVYDRPTRVMYKGKACIADKWKLFI